MNPTLLVPDWHKTPHGKELFAAIHNKNTQKRKAFTLLEKPIVPSPWNPGEFNYKIFVSGRSGVGKTSLVAKLSANPVPQSHCETPGIQVSVVYWPAFMVDINAAVMFKLQLWDVGESALRKFDHVLPACKDHIDGLLYMFSFTDKASFEDLPQQMSRILGPEDSSVCQYVLGTKLDLCAEGEVTQQDIEEFERHWSIPVHSINNLSCAYQHDPRQELDDTAPVLNHLCQELWRRDRRLVEQAESRHGAAARHLRDT